MSEETSVPKISGKAPNSSATGSQVLVVTKSKPNRPIASRAPTPELVDQEAEQDRNGDRGQREQASWKTRSP